MRMSLAVKREYLRAIKAGTKTVEYRACTPFYTRMFANPKPTLHLHCYDRESVVVAVREITIVPNPFARDERPRFLLTDDVFALELGGILEATENVEKPS